MSDSPALERLRATAARAEAVPHARPSEGHADGDGVEAPDRAGRVGKSPPWGLVLEPADGTAETVPYAALCSTVRHWPELGLVGFVFEGDREVEPGRVEHGRWHVRIYGADLAALHHQLSAGVRLSVRVTGRGVTAITVQALGPGR